MSPATHKEPSTLGIKIWIALGVIVFLFLTVAPIMARRNVQNEVDRFQGCQRHTRTDCRTSMMWYTAGWTLDEPATNTATSVEPAAPATPEVVPPIKPVAPLNLWYTEDDAIRDPSLAAYTPEYPIDTAPRILNVTSTGGVWSNGFYLVKEGATITVRVKLDRKPNGVWASLEQGKNAGTASPDWHSAGFKQTATNEYSGTFQMPAVQMPYAIAIRASMKGSEETSIVYLRFASTE